MPVHDWSRVRAGMFHHFHNSWVYRLSDRLNDEILPTSSYASGEPTAGDAEPLTSRRFASHADEPLYVSKQDHVVIRSSEGDRLVALIEIVSRGNKDSRARFHAFVDKVTAAIERGCHVMVVDLFPPGSLDPGGMHGAVWEQLTGTRFEQPEDRPLTLVSYQSGAEPTAWVEPIRIGETLPQMPLFLDAEWYVQTPLEETYEQTWRGFPGPWKEAVEVADS